MSKRKNEPQELFLHESATVRRTLLSLRISLIISVLIFPVFFNMIGGVAMCLGGGVRYGVMMLISSIIILTSVGLCFGKVNITSIIVCFAGFALCVLVTYKYTEIMRELGKSDFNLEPRYAKYAPRHYSTIIVFVLLSIISIIQHFSYSEVTKRQSRRKIKKELENAEAPRILEND